MTKKYKVLAGILAVGALSLMGCSADSNTQVVVPKEKKEKYISGQETEENVAEQVQAPDRYQWDKETKNLHIYANARVIVPNVEGIRLKKIKSCKFSKEDLDQIQKGLCGDASAYILYVEDENEGAWETEAVTEPAMENNTMEEYDGSAKVADIDDKDKLRELILDYLDGTSSLTKDDMGKIGELLVESAGKEQDPWERFKDCWMGELLKEYALFGVEEPLNQMKIDASYSYQSGFYLKAWEPFAFYISNAPKELEQRSFTAYRIGAEITNEQKYDSQILSEESVENTGTGFLPDAQKESQELLNEMGFSDLELANISDRIVFYWTTLDSDEVGQEGVCLEYTRVVDGVPVTYTSQERYFHSDDTEVVEWPYERISVVYDENGMASFSWNSPMQVEDWHDEYAFLLPFSEIQKIFEEMMVGNFQSEKDYSVFQDINVQEVRLGYMPVASKEVVTGDTNCMVEDGKTVYYGMLVPVWDFIGTVTGDMAYKYDVESGSKISYMTINAMDGSIISRQN